MAVEPEAQVSPEASLSAAQVIPQAAPPQSHGAVNVLNPEGELVSIPTEQVADALENGYQPASDEHVAQYAKEQKYGSAGQQAITALEGIGQGLAGPLATGAEVSMGIKPEDMRGREEVNPGTHLASEVAGLAAPALLTGGASVAERLGVEGAAEAGAAIAGVSKYTQASVLGQAGEAVAGATGLGGKAAGYMSQVGAETVKGAFEAALFQGGEEVSRTFKEDPHQTAESAIADIGLAGVMGGVFGGALGAALKAPSALQGVSHELPGTFVSELDQAGMEAGDFATSIKNSNIIKESEKEGILAGLGEEKENAKEIRSAAERLGAPVMEGMVSASKAIQKAEDSLINGVETVSGIRRRKLYADGYRKAEGAVEAALGEGSTYSKAEIGDIFQTSIVKDLEAQNAPIKAMYDELKQYHSIIPLSDKSAPAIIRNLKNIPEFRVSPSSPEGQMVSRVARELENLKTVDDIKIYKNTLSTGFSATPGEKRMAGIIRDKLTDLEESSIERFAKQQMKTPEAKSRILDLVEQRKAANGQYKEFIGKVQTLAEQLGKGRVYGIQDAINFIKDLTPEQVTSRLFAKNNSGFLKFFEKEFPEQMQLMKDYQKGVLREQSSKAGEFSTKNLFNKVNKLEPEIQKSIFTSEELSKIRDAETYIRAIPENFNPSGTANMMAFRQFFEHPTGAIIANARDYAIEKFIKAVAAAPDVRKAVDLAKATVAGIKSTDKAAKAVFQGTMPATVIPIEAHRAKLAKIVEDYSKNPEKMFQIGDNNPVPEYGQAFAQTSTRAMQYLNGLRPNSEPKNPLDRRVAANPFEQSKYNRALDVAQKPLSVLKRMKEGTLTPDDVITIRTIYPKMYDRIAQRLTENMINQVEKGQAIPYKTRVGLALFLGKPLDSTMTPEGILGAQPKPAAAQPESPLQPASNPKHSTANLNKTATMAQTPGQARIAEKSSGK